MTRAPTEEEVKEAVFNLNKVNICGPNGFLEDFFLTCWEIIKNDIRLMVMVIFCGGEIPIYFSHKCSSNFGEDQIYDLSA